MPGPRVLLHAFPTFAFGGQQARFVQLANAYGAQFRHLIVAMDGCFEAGARLAPGVPWEAVPFQNQRGGGLANRGAARALLARLQPQQLFTYNWGAVEWLAANLPRRVPHVHVEDGFGPDEARGQLPRRVWTRRLLLGLAGTPVAVPSSTLARLAPGWWVRPGRLQFIPNGVPVAAAFPARLAAADAGVGAGGGTGRGRPLVVGTVAGLRREKNVARLVRAFAAAVQAGTHPALRLVVVGDGPERPALQALAAQLGVADAVEFTGYLPQPLARLSGFDLFALSSDTEQLPMAMLEAMALGIPVVATRVGDVPDVLPPLAHAGLSAVDDAAYARVLQQVLAQRPAWPAWAAAGHARVREHYAEAVTLARWRAVYEGRFSAAGPQAAAVEVRPC